MSDSASPFARAQQYRDAAIWEAVLSTADVHDVHFVSGDKVFFDRNPQDGFLAQGLDNDVARAARDLSLYWTLANCVERLQGDAPAVDIQDVGLLLRNELWPTVTKDADRFGYKPQAIYETEVRPFVTEDPHTLSIDFTLSADLEDAAGVGRFGAVRVYGDCRYKPDETAISDVQIDRVVIDVQNDDGSIQQHRSAYMRGTLGGATERIHRVRLPLAGSQYLVIESEGSGEGEMEDLYMGS